MKIAISLIALLLSSPLVLAQDIAVIAPKDTDKARSEEIAQLRAEMRRLSARLDALESSGRTIDGNPASARLEDVPSSSNVAANASSGVAMPSTSASPAESASTSSAAVGPALQTQHPDQPSNTPPLISAIPASLPGGVTLNYTFDGYYGYNLNRPPGRVNDLRAYDVLSNVFSINQAAVIFALDPNVKEGRRFGLRVDLQYGQATDTLQGNPANEPRPDIYRNIFQAYGTYVVPVGSGLNIDFGKWSSSLGIEGNYSKDQMNYTRSFYFYFLPFYHAGVRASYHVSDKLALNYWAVNGNNQSEPTNGFKDELFGFVLQPAKTVSWTSNYYVGQEHPDTAAATNCTVPEQPGLCFTPVTPAPNGKLHIFDNYVTWQVRPKFTLSAEGDYVIQRLWATAAPGESAAPSHVIGGALYAQYQPTPRTSLAARTEYLSDRGGLFSSATQALKETTATYKYTLADGLDLFAEYRRDWSNLPYFTTHNVGLPSDHQTTATVGLVWWYGGKHGAW